MAAKSLDIKKLKTGIIKVLESYIANPEDKAVKEKAKDFYLSYLNADAFLPKELSSAKNILVDIAYETGVKADSKRIKQLIRELQAA